MALVLPEGAKIPADLQIKVPDPVPEGAYPIVTYTWVICRNCYRGDDARKGAALKKVLLYCAGEGQKISGELGYIPLPDDVVRRVKDSIEQIKIEGAPDEK